MGFTINEEITTKLHYKDIANICVTISHYIDLYGDKMDDENKMDMLTLVNRLGNEMYNHPDNDVPNGDN